MSTARTRVAWSAILLLAVAAGRTEAQEFRGRVQGIVSDTTGAIVPGVGVVLRNDNTGVEVSRTTNKDGWYLFDYVDPGTYTITAALGSFKTEIRKGVRVQQRADLTVDFKLELGSLVESVSVTEAPLGLQFTTATRDLTVEQALVKELPSTTRNPFQLALLDPMTVNRGSTVETQPFFHRTAMEMDIGGGTKYRNDVLLDGTPLAAGNKLGYTPPMDSVTEYTVLQNAVDAEFGHNSGGVAVATMKSGSNDIHATAYYYGRDAGWNAISDRAIHQHSDNPYWNAGATLGLPIMKNKLFLFAVFDKIEYTQSSAGYYTLPSALERQGDFSQSYNADGSLRVIYDPATSRYGPNGELIRDPFPGNKIPSNRWDPLAARIVNGLWDPNNPGDDKSGFNNFKYQQQLKFHYYNFSTRLDWNINDHWKTYARVSRMATDQDGNDYTNGDDPLKLRNITGSKRNGWNMAADTVYTFNPTTTFNLRGSFYQAEDKREYPDMAIGDQGMQALWPSDWWQPYAADRPLIYSPYIIVDSTARAQFGVQNFWFQAPRGYSLHARLSKYLTRHTLKAGTEIRWKRGEAARYYFTQFQFASRDTANAWASPDTKTGNPWASFLLGALDSQTPSTGGATNSRVQFTPSQTANTEMYGFYVQDDFRVTRDVTLNLGLRYEYEGGFWDPQNRLPQRLDLNDPIPGMQDAIDPKMPAKAREMMAQSAGQKSYSYDGAFYFTEPGNDRKTNAWKYGFMPRIGLAWRLGEKTVARAGYGRFVTPTSLANAERDTLGEIDLSAFSPTTSVLPNNNGVPAAYLSDPFPQGLTPAYGKSYGRYTSLGDTITIDEYDQRTPISDRINVSVQHELPFRLIVDATYLVNFISHDQYSRNLNMQDPRLQYTYGADYGKSVANPFYNYGTEATFPGALRRQKTVPISQLLRPYPQYGDIIQTGTDERKARYQSFQLRLQRPFEKGFSFLVSYAYVKTESQWYFDPVDDYDHKLTWMPFSVTQAGRTGAPIVYADPTHRLATAATVELPIGRNHRFGSNLPTVLDAIVGGWQLSGVFSYQSGAPLIFSNAMVAPDTVTQKSEVGSNKFWFDTTGFAKQPAYTRRTNPWTYDGLNGPDYKNLDLTLSKRFKLVRGATLQLRLDAFNALNGMNWAQPTLDVTKSDFGKTNAQAVGYYGRQLQYSARVEF